MDKDLKGIFLDNKYSRWYFSIIDRASKRNWKKKDCDFYFERHHIIPRSLGGNDAALNIVGLSPKEHFICHRLLTKMTYGKFRAKMTYALGRMVHKKDLYEVSARIYAHLKLEWANLNRGKNHPSYGTKLTDQQKEHLRQLNKGKKLTDDHKKKIQASLMNHPTKPSTIEKIKATILAQGGSRKGAKLSQETKDKISKGNLGLKTGISPANKGVPHTEEAKRKMREAKIGHIPWNKGVKMKPWTDEFRAKIMLIRKDVVSTRVIKKIVQLSASGDFIKEWDSVNDVCAFYNVTIASVYRTLRNQGLNEDGSLRLCKGYAWIRSFEKVV